jgi:hypothetical protein
MVRLAPYSSAFFADGDMSVRIKQAENALAGLIFGFAFVCLLAVSAVSCRTQQPASAPPGGSATDAAPYGAYPEPPWQEVKNAALHVPVPEMSTTTASARRVTTFT